MLDHVIRFVYALTCHLWTTETPSSPTSATSPTATNNTNNTPTSPNKMRQQQRVFCRDDMAAWDLLQRPLWVFDCQTYRMWWANESGLELWNAKSRDELLARDYSSDMSESVKLRCSEVMGRVARGELFNEQVSICCPFAM
jgi:hypothetical protein